MVLRVCLVNGVFMEYNVKHTLEGFLLASEALRDI